jgi:tRNA U34 5-methylaminomethyl-2-thiouridine-forming methyltransferase MnmC
MKVDLIKTKDGSHTLYRPDLNEYYHSIHGAIQESQHVYINSGLKCISRPVIRIFEMGFGTGLNVILSLIEAEKTNRFLIYDSIEKFPLNSGIINILNYKDLIPSEYREKFLAIHHGKWDEILDFKNMQLTKISGDFLKYEFTAFYDLIYFDAFGPEKQPELWSAEIFHKIFNATNEGGLLMTFSVKGEVRRSLNQAGFKIEKLVGPPGKKQILKAEK